LEGQGGDFDLHLFSPNVTKIPPPRSPPGLDRHYIFHCNQIVSKLAGWPTSNLIWKLEHPFG